MHNAEMRLNIFSKAAELCRPSLPRSLPRTKPIEGDGLIALRDEEDSPLRQPKYRKPSHQCRQRDRTRLLSAQNSGNNVRLQQGQPQDATDVGLIDFLGVGELRDGRVGLN